MRYGRDLGCRFGQPHDIRILKETPHAKYEICQICSKRFRWNKGYKGRTNNVEYLKAHVRNFAQNGGATNRVYQRIYKAKNCIITL